MRIGIDRPGGAAVGTPGALAAPDELRSYPRATFTDLARVHDEGDAPAVLDVRRDDERAAGEIRDRPTSPCTP